MRLPFAVVICVTFSFLSGCGGSGSSRSSAPVQTLNQSQVIKNIDESVAPVSVVTELQWISSEELQHTSRVDTFLLPPVMTGFDDLNSTLEVKGFHLQGAHFKYYLSALQIFSESDLSKPIAVAELNLGAIPKALAMETNEVLVFASNEEYVDVGSEQPLDIAVSSKVIPEGIVIRPTTEITWINVDDFYNPSVNHELSFYGEVLGMVRGQGHWLVVSGLTDLPAESIDGCYVFVGDESAEWGQVFSVSLIDTSTKTLAETVCIRADLNQIAVSGNALSLHDSKGGLHEFLWSSKSIEYLGSQ